MGLDMRSQSEIVLITIFLKAKNVSADDIQINKNSWGINIFNLGKIIHINNNL